jgi:hypothetical protein
VDDPGAGHRLDHRPHPLALQALSEMTQAVEIRRRRGVLDELAAGSSTSAVASTPRAYARGGAGSLRPK